MIKYRPDDKKFIHCDDLQLDPCGQDQVNWVCDKLAKIEELARDHICIKDSKSDDIPDTSGTKDPNMADTLSKQCRYLPSQGVTNANYQLKP